MAISKENKEFVESLIDYYISESGSYVQMAEGYDPVESVPDAAFGIIVGCIYAGFMQACQNQQITPGLEEVRELGQIIGGRSKDIAESVRGQKDES